MAFEARVILSSNRPLRFDDRLCIGCNRCMEACQMDIMLPGDAGAHPVVVYPGECWYCGACVMECPIKGAIRLVHPVMNETSFREVIKNECE